MPASYSNTSNAFDKLLAGPADHIRSKQVIVKSGQSLLRGTLLGRVAGAVAAAVAGAGNTGNGVFGAVTLGDNAKEGTYRVVIIEPAVNAGAFQVEDPDGVIVGTGTVAVPFVGPVNFTLADGATDFVAGDQWTIAVAEGTKFNQAIATAADGSDQPDCILAEDCDASLADQTTVAYQTGDFNEAAVIFGAGLTAASTKEPLRKKGIHLITVQA